MRKAFWFGLLASQVIGSRAFASDFSLVEVTQTALFVGGSGYAVYGFDRFTDNDLNGDASDQCRGDRSWQADPIVKSCLADERDARLTLGHVNELAAPGPAATFTGPAIARGRTSESGSTRGFNARAAARLRWRCLR